MNEAKIEIRSRNIDSFLPIPDNPQHLFVIFTDSKGHKTILRGGPETDGAIGMLKDDLKVINAPYDKKHEHLFTNDLVENAPSQIIASGTDAEMQALVDKMWARGQEINNGKFDYKLPTPGCPASLCHVQNSNNTSSIVGPEA